MIQIREDIELISLEKDAKCSANCIPKPDFSIQMKDFVKQVVIILLASTYVGEVKKYVHLNGNIVDYLIFFPLILIPPIIISLINYQFAQMYNLPHKNYKRAVAGSGFSWLRGIFYGSLR